MREYKPEFLYLITTGWKSGQPHEIEIWYVEHDSCYYLCAEHRENTHWVRNIQHQTAVSFRVNGPLLAGTGRVLDSNAEPELTHTVSTLFDQKYNWSDGLLVELRATSE